MVFQAHQHSLSAARASQDPTRALRHAKRLYQLPRVCKFPFKAS